jgi:hypothetical protein
LQPGSGYRGGEQRISASGWQRQYAASRDKKLPSERKPRRLTLLEKRLGLAEYHFGELLFTLYICREEQFEKATCERYYQFRLQGLQKDLDGPATWAKAYERRRPVEQDTIGVIEERLWLSREAFYHLQVSILACQQQDEAIWSEAMRKQYEPGLEALRQALGVDEETYQRHYRNKR